MDLYSVFVTGANSGIGLEFVRQLSCLQKPPQYIFATYRSATSLSALEEIKDSSKECNIVLVQMDVKKLKDVVAARKVVQQTVGENGLTLLINNAGFLLREAFPEITEEGLYKHFKVNAVGPVTILLQELLPLLEKAASRGGDQKGMSVSRAAVINISISRCITGTGVEFTQDLGEPWYKMSKYALSMAMRVITAKGKSKGILVVMMCPGWLKTDILRVEAQITPGESVSTMLQTFENLQDAHHGTFMDRLGN